MLCLEEMEQAHQAEEGQERAVDLVEEEKDKVEWPGRAPGRDLVEVVFAPNAGQRHRTKGVYLA